MELTTEIPSVNLLVIKKYYYRGIYRRNKYFFITNRFTDGKKITDERFTDGAFPSVN